MLTFTSVSDLYGGTVYTLVKRSSALHASSSSFDEEPLMRVEEHAPVDMGTYWKLVLEQTTSWVLDLLHTNSPSYMN